MTHGQATAQSAREAPAFALETTAQSQRRPGGPALGGPALPSSWPALPASSSSSSQPSWGTSWEPPGETWLRSRETSRAGHPLSDTPRASTVSPAHGHGHGLTTVRCTSPSDTATLTPNGMVTGGGPWGGSRWYGWGPGEGNQRPSEREPEPALPVRPPGEDSSRPPGGPPSGSQRVPCCCRPNSASTPTRRMGTSKHVALSP